MVACIHMTMVDWGFGRARNHPKADAGFLRGDGVLVTAMEEAQVKRLICVTALDVRLAQRHRGPCRTVVMPRSSRNA
jgi:hypothetical protein